MQSYYRLKLLIPNRASGVLVNHQYEFADYSTMIKVISRLQQWDIENPGEPIKRVATTEHILSTDVDEVMVDIAYQINRGIER